MRKTEGSNQPKESKEKMAREKKTRTYIYVRTDKDEYFTSPKLGRDLVRALVNTGHVLYETAELTFTTARIAVTDQVHRDPQAAFEGLRLSDFEPRKKPIALTARTTVNPVAAAASYWRNILEETEEAEITE